MVLERKKILLVEPDAEAMQPLKTLLLQRGCRVGQVDSGERALQLCARELPNAVITGLRLPKMSGEELLRQLQSDARTTGIPVIIIAEQRLLDDRVRVIELCPDDFVPKPYVAQEVVARLAVVLNDSRPAPAGTTPDNLDEGFSGSLADMSPVDLIEIFHAAGRSGTLQLRNNGQRGTIYLHEGEIVDAICGHRSGEEALAVLLLWNEGTFLADFAAAEVPRRVSTPTRELLASALARAEEWNDATATLPPLRALLQRSEQSASAQVGEEERTLLGQFTSPRSIAQFVCEAAGNPLSLVHQLRALWDKGLLRLCSDEALSTERPSSSSLMGHSVASRSPLVAVAELFASGGPTPSTPGPLARKGWNPVLTRAELLVTRARMA